MGLARYLLRQLEKHAASQGIEGFCSEILPTNEAMLGYHRGLGHSMVYSQETDTYHMEFRFSPKASGSQKEAAKTSEWGAGGDSGSGFSG